MKTTTKSGVEWGPCVTLDASGRRKMSSSTAGGSQKLRCVGMQAAGDELVAQIRGRKSSRGRILSTF